ncbi:MAG: tRNA pseudouridine(55) synthase TruB [Mycoplasmatales bacterium]|nr:tRNA pseudouridine(55) synthase TruB [Mycoplasmatales bacterium]
MFYLINKKSGISSFKCIQEFARKRHIKKIGHTGTLDPLASGLLLVATGDDTRLIEYIDKGFKSYIVTMKLGYKSDTLDIEGDVVKVNLPWKDEDVLKVINSYVKSYNQMPPIFSAKKINGKRSYELARKGIEVKLNPSKVIINKIDSIEKIDKETFKFEVEVSRGTYIRSLVRDIAHSLKTEAIMTNLIRNKIANLDFNDLNKKLDVRELVKLNKIELNKKDLSDLFLGKKINIQKLDGKYAIEYNQDIIGIIDLENNSILKRKLFGNKYKVQNESS